MSGIVFEDFERCRSPVTALTARDALILGRITSIRLRGVALRRIGERCEAEDYLIKLQLREFGASFHVPEPNGVVTGA